MKRNFALHVRPDGTPRPVVTTALVAATFVVSSMPAFLTGASGVFLRAELGFDEAQLGAAISTFFGSFALTPVVGGRFAERVGAGRALTVAAFSSAAVLLGIAVLARDYYHLLAFLMLGGIVNGIAEPATNLALARAVAVRQALMFGVKQSAIPMVTLLSGASVPLVGLTLGWRWAFAAGALLAMLIGLSMPRQLAPPRPRKVSGRLREGDVATTPLVAMAIASGCGTAAAVCLGAFLVGAAVASGIDVGVAGWLMVAGSVSGITARLTVGWLADRWRGIALYVVATMLALGAGGYGLMASGRPGLLAVGSLIAFSCGWGWVGLMMYAIARLNSNAPAAASAIVLTGAAAGAALGPVMFGRIVTAASFDAAWGAAAGAALVSAALVLCARMLVLRDRDRRAVAEGS